ncbi:mercury methylation corrinoid protein HgcA [Desulfoluna sp.]|uniref:mercury methylation corrinoid protein HgcA n=1 Tax=Desulfoluna sp. TaxID=2045199 RepID=UPI00263676D4|nr:mercury methylation corrinoid protein HgcA [Desulfoluna sp.]
MKDNLMAFGESAARDLGAPCCCGPASEGDDREMPGYSVCRFVDSFMETPEGAVPVVKTRLERVDHLGTLAARCNVGRSDYRVAPGLYAVGEPTETAPVLVTANYKMSFDAVRRTLSGMNAWLLVVDTKGINVWCAAGKGSFSAEGVAAMVTKTGLTQVVSHRKLILPQLCANGVTAREVKKRCGFRAEFGPLRASDLPGFIQSGLNADAGMRRITFTLKERLELMPVEVSLTGRHLLWLVPALFLLSGVGPGFFSFSQAVLKGVAAWSALFTGILAGAVITPALLPWLPGRAFAVKGALAGLLCGLPFGLFYWNEVGMGSLFALICWLTAVSSYLAMNFTGATPYTSPTGVEHEMKRAIPAQAVAVIVGLIIWLAAPFTG